MIVRHRWDSKTGLCQRCGAERRIKDERTQFRAEGAAWWCDTIGDCRGDLNAAHRVIKQIPLPGRTTTYSAVMYRGSRSNCEVWLRDHKKLMKGYEVAEGFYKIEQREGSAWVTESSSSSRMAPTSEKPTTPRAQRRKPDVNSIPRCSPKRAPSSGSLFLTDKEPFTTQKSSSNPAMNGS